VVRLMRTDHDVSSAMFYPADLSDTGTATAARNKAVIDTDLRKRRVSVQGLPYFYHVHLHMPCNQRCIMCVPSGRHPDTTLPYEEFVKLFEQVRDFAEHITLIGGEPLLYPRLDSVLDLLAQHPIAVTINTNATRLDGAISKRLLNLHELHLKCSIDAATREMYWRIRGTDAFDGVVENIRRFAEVARQRSHVKLILVYVVMRENLSEVLPFIELFKDTDLERIEFHPVRHVSDWVVENRTGWTFHGAQQSCEAFPGEYNEIMNRARRMAEQYAMEIEVQPVPGG